MFEQYFVHLSLKNNCGEQNVSYQFLDLSNLEHGF